LSEGARYKRRRVDDEQVLEQHPLPLREVCRPSGEPELLLDVASLPPPIRVVAAADEPALRLHLVLARLDRQPEQAETALRQVGHGPQRGEVDPALAGLAAGLG